MKADKAKKKTPSKAPRMRKVTVMLPAELLDRAMRVSGEGITPTITEGLQQIAVQEAFQHLAAARGTVQFTTDLRWLRED